MGRSIYLGVLALTASLLLAGTPQPILETTPPPPTADVTSALQSPTDPDATIAPPSSPAAPEPTAAPLGRPIDGARIVISRLGIDLPLAWGDIGRDVPRDDYAGATPERVALVFPGSALPGTGGNTYIYSHARTGMFLALWSVRPGDIIVLAWPDAEMRYTVERVIPRVDPTETSWLDPAGPERLTLQTSTGPNAGDPRFVVVAMPVGTRP